MAIDCNKCKHSNPDDAKYCNHCGEELSAVKKDDEQSYVAINEKDLNAQVYVEEFKKNMQAYAEITRHQALDKFQAQATSWAKFQFAGVVTAITILAAFLGFIGFKGIDLQDTIDGAQEHIKDSADNAKVQIDLLKEQLKETVANAKDVISKGTEDITDTQKEAKDLKNKIDEGIKDLGEARKVTLQSKADLNQRLKQIENLQVALADQIKKVEKLERSRYKIQVHYDIAQVDDNYRDTIAGIQAALLDQGYVIGSDNIMSVSADKQQVIYFTNSSEVRENVEKIKSALTNRFGKIDIEPQKMDASDIKDPYKIIVKLCRKLKADKISCDNSSQ